MRNFLGVILVATGLLRVLPAIAQAQEATDSSAVAWLSSLSGNVAGSQVGFQNWAEGGVNTLALSLGVNGEVSRTSSRWKQTHTLKLAYGVVKQDTLDFRKAEDLIRFTSTFDYIGGGLFPGFAVTIAFNFRSQFAPGFNFQENPLADDRTLPVKVADFLSPGVFSQAIGVTYEPAPWFRQRLGIGGKQTVVLIERLRPLYSLSPDRSVRFEVGIEGHTEIDRELFENVHYKSTLGLFAAFNQPENPDLLWENLIVMTVNSWLRVNFEWDAVYDADVSSKAQFKEIFSVGITYTIL